jgi:hypothetical protein
MSAQPKFILNPQLVKIEFTTRIGRTRKIRTLRIDNAQKFLKYNATRVASAIIFAVTLSGCSSFTSLNAEWEHHSDPTRGSISTRGNEDILDTYNFVGRFEKGSLYTEIGLGYQPYQQGFDGSGVIFTSRVGITLWSKQ